MTSSSMQWHARFHATIPHAHDREQAGAAPSNDDPPPLRRLKMAHHTHRVRTRTSLICMAPERRNLFSAPVTVWRTAMNDRKAVPPPQSEGAGALNPIEPPTPEGGGPINLWGPQGFGFWLARRKIAALNRPQGGLLGPASVGRRGQRVTAQPAPPGAVTGRKSCVFGGGGGSALVWWWCVGGPQGGGGGGVIPGRGGGITVRW